MSLPHVIYGDRVCSFLAAVDADLAAEARAGGCRHCGGRLHSARYPRMVELRGAGEPAKQLRLSYCCADCRKRHTPPSVRFFGRRGFSAAVFIVVSAMLGVPRRLRELCRELGVSRRTVGRWRRWWTTTFAASRVWSEVRARLGGGLPPDARALLDRVPGTELQRIVRLLLLLGDLTAGSAWSPEPAS